MQFGNPDFRGERGGGREGEREGGREGEGGHARKITPNIYI